ncbi:MAG TPA: hypothetical protein PK950_02735, partial [Candidatus Paceibacterota bacterium]|nr:hypothetical protein [Candidatus Paceibacterota bacterium]
TWKGPIIASRKAIPCIFQAIEKVLGIDEAKLRSKSREKPLPEARNILCKIAKEFFNIGPTEGGQLIEKSHCAFINGNKVHNKRVLLRSEHQYRKEYLEIFDLFVSKVKRYTAVAPAFTVEQIEKQMEQLKVSEKDRIAVVAYFTKKALDSIKFSSVEIAETCKDIGINYVVSEQN